MAGGPPEATAVAARPGTRIRGLEGLRAIAFGGVFVLHSGVPILPSGSFGVDIFFVLSGYLITNMLLAEHSRNGSIDFRNFYIRRALRLYPAMIVMVVAVLAASSILGARLPSDSRPTSGLTASAASTMLYLNDFIEGFGFHVARPFGHTWSVAVDEHFYMLWPVVLVVLIRWALTPRRIIALLLGAALAMQVGDAVFWVMNGSDYFVDANPFGRPVGLPIGCALAIGVRYELFSVRRVARAAPLSLVLLVGLMALPKVHSERSFGGLLLPCALTAVVVCGAIANQPGIMRWVLTNPVARWGGDRSYSIYLWHFPIFAMITTAGLHSTGVVAFARLAAAFGLAELSYRLIERPVRGLKDRFGPRDRRGPARPLPPGAGLTPVRRTDPARRTDRARRTPV